MGGLLGGLVGSFWWCTAELVVKRDPRVGLMACLPSEAVFVGLRADALRTGLGAGLCGLLKEPWGFCLLAACPFGLVGFGFGPDRLPALLLAGLGLLFWVVLS